MVHGKWGFATTGRRWRRGVAMAMAPRFRHGFETAGPPRALQADSSVTWVTKYAPRCSNERFPIRENRSSSAAAGGRASSLGSARCSPPSPPPTPPSRRPPFPRESHDVGKQAQRGRRPRRGFISLRHPPSGRRNAPRAYVPPSESRQNSSGDGPNVRVAKYRCTKILQTLARCALARPHGSRGCERHLRQ